jgi:hypothetical protein
VVFTGEYWMNGESAALFSKLSSSVPGSDIRGKSENCMVWIIRVNFLGDIRRPEHK